MNCLPAPQNYKNLEIKNSVAQKCTHIMFKQTYFIAKDKKFTTLGICTQIGKADLGDPSLNMRKADEINKLQRFPTVKAYT